jgi:hypothetical protein
MILLEVVKQPLQLRLHRDYKSGRVNESRVWRMARVSPFCASWVSSWS